MDQPDEFQDNLPEPSGAPDGEPAAAGPAATYDTPPGAGGPVDEPARLDLNTATAAQLSSLPGITATMATRIVDYRAKNGPFLEPAEITRVRGVSRAHYERIAGQVTAGAPSDTLDFAAEPEPLPAAGLPEPAAEPQPLPSAGLPEPAPYPEPAPAVAAAPDAEAAPAARPTHPAPPPPPLKLAELEPANGPSWAGVLVVGLLSILLGAALAIAILALVNGTLQFGRAALVRDMSADVQQLEREVQQLNGELSAMRSQLERGQASVDAMQQQVETAQGQLDLLTRDLSAVRTEFRGLRADVDAMGGSVDELQGRADRVETQLGRLAEEMRTINASVQRFEAFLAGLRALLRETQPADATSPLTPAATPGTRLPQRTPTPTP